MNYNTLSNVCFYSLCHITPTAFSLIKPNPLFSLSKIKHIPFQSLRKKFISEHNHKSMINYLHFIIFQNMDLLDESHTTQHEAQDIDQDEILNSPNDTIVEQLGTLQVESAPATSTPATSEANNIVTSAFGTISGLPWPPVRGQQDCDVMQGGIDGINPMLNNTYPGQSTTHSNTQSSSSVHPPARSAGTTAAEQSVADDVHPDEPAFQQNRATMPQNPNLEMCSSATAGQPTVPAPVISQQQLPALDAERPTPASSATSQQPAVPRAQQPALASSAGVSNEIRTAPLPVAAPITQHPAPVPRQPAPAPACSAVASNAVAATIDQRPTRVAHQPAVAAPIAQRPAPVAHQPAQVLAAQVAPAAQPQDLALAAQPAPGQLHQAGQARGARRRRGNRRQQGATTRCLLHNRPAPCNVCTRAQPYTRQLHSQPPPRPAPVVAGIDESILMRLATDIMSSVRLYNIHLDFYRLREELRRSYNPNP